MAESGGSGGTAVRGASLLILLQVASRAVTFAANQFLLRYLTPQLLGVSSQLEVYYLSVLFFARESLRVAIQRQGGAGEKAGEKAEEKTEEKRVDDKDGKNSKRGDRDGRTQAGVNGAYISVALGLAVAPLLGWLYLLSVRPSTLASTPYLVSSLYLYAGASVLELLSEPAFVVMQLRLDLSVRARAEALATTARCAAALFAAVWAARRSLDLGVLPFALGQAVYGVTLLAVYTRYGLGLSRRQGFSLLPAKLDSKTDDYVLSYFYRPTLQLASSMTAQSVVKHLLTQGDTFLVSILSTPTAQGVYALANNYGGLVARLVFQPVEESSRSYFSRLLAPDESKKGPSSTSVRQAGRDLQALVKTYLLLSLLVVALGPAAAPRLLALVAGSNWAESGAGACLSAYAWYVPLLAVNGVAEAFVASVAAEADVHRQSAWMAVFSLAFGAAGFVSLRVLGLGAVGLVCANAINMACRIAWCAVFVSRYFTVRGVSFDLVALLPGPWAVLASAVASQAVRLVLAGGSGAGAGGAVVDLAKIAAVALPYLGVFALSEQMFLRQTLQAIRGLRAGKSS